MIITDTKQLAEKIVKMLANRPAGFQDSTGPLTLVKSEKTSYEMTVDAWKSIHDNKERYTLYIVGNKRQWQFIGEYVFRNTNDLTAQSLQNVLNEIVTDITAKANEIGF